MAMLRKIITDIEEHQQSRKPRSQRSDWYIGIATNPEERLFNAHAVSEKNGQWIHIKADSTNEALEAESFLRDLGYDGGKGPRDDNNLFVYAYRKTPDTRE